MYVLLDLCSRGSLAVPRDQLNPQVAVREVAARHLRWLLASVQECTEEYRYRFPECELYNFHERKHRLQSV